jgi:uncharacterized protein YdeI (YjbR/CyaY-like superfamily)
MPEAHPKDGRPILTFATAARFEAWMKKNHATFDGIWLKFAKRGSGVASVYYPEALEIALCYGWIDSQVAKQDAAYYLQRFTPRGPRSYWSQINVAKCEQLIGCGRMQPAGQSQVDAARKDGRWAAASESPKNATVPPDLQAALDKNMKAAAFFATLRGANRYAILYRLREAKKPETRKKRLEEFVQMLKEGKTLH